MWRNRWGQTFRSSPAIPTRRLTIWGSEATAVRAMERLGVRLPTGDRGPAWRIVQVRMVGALNALREEVELLDGPA